MTQAPQDPWDGYDKNGVYAADYLYCGPRESIPCPMEQARVCLDFETWAYAFRQSTRKGIFSEEQSIEMAGWGVRRDTRGI